jgi:hypothetical protein
MSLTTRLYYKDSREPQWWDQVISASGAFEQSPNKGNPEYHFEETLFFDYDSRGKKCADVEPCGNPCQHLWGPYKSLAPNETRVIVFTPTEEGWSTPQLKVINLDADDTYRTSYTAISYTWGGDICCAQQTGMHKLGCGSTAYSVGTVYGGKGHLYTPGVRPASVATPRRPTVDALHAPLTTPCSPRGRRPARPVRLTPASRQPKRGLCATILNEDYRRYRTRMANHTRSRYPTIYLRSPPDPSMK